MDDTGAVGSSGVISVATRGADGPGEVLVSLRGSTEAYLAWSEEPLPLGSRVLVTGARGPRAVDVVPYDALGV